MDDRKAAGAESELRESEARYRSLFEGHPVPMWIYDLETLRFLDVNNAAIHRYGYSRDEFLGMTIKEIRPPEDVPALLENVSRVTEGLDEAGIWRHRKKDGATIEVEIVSHTLTFDGRRAELVMATDVTGRRRAEAALRAREEQLLHAQKMEAVGRLAGGIAHDFNNLLTAITGYGDIVLSRLRESDPMRSEIKEIMKAGERAASLTRQLLAFSRRQVMQPKVLDLNVLMINLEKMLRRLIGEDVELSTSLQPGLGRVKADAGQIEQVVVNLVVNSRDAMPRGGMLTIETRDAMLDDAYARGRADVTPGPYVMLAVSDTGHGMDEETMSHLFEPFYTTKEQGKGTGLGLATAYGIVRQSGGHVWVYSEPGKGTTFKVYLPRVDESPDAVGTAMETRPLLKGSETVLLMEDEEIVRNLVREILEIHGYTVIAAADCAEAVSVCETSDRTIHLLVTDVVMPGMSGQELAVRVAPLRPAMKVLYMSGYTDEAIVHHGILDRGVEYIQKPFRPDDLARAVRRVLDAPPRS